MTIYAKTAFYLYCSYPLSQNKVVRVKENWAPKLGGEEEGKVAHHIKLILTALVCIR